MHTVFRKWFLNIDYAESLQCKQLLNRRHIHEHQTSEIQVKTSSECVQMLQTPAQHLEDIT